jgi:NAD(P)-dependent dehydrogenase (short-subunit alcohol dehydrogenase family)
MGGRLEGKVCVITGTGGSRGSAAHVFVREGARVVGCDINQAAGDAVTAEVTAAGDTMVSLQPCNLTGPSQCQALVNLAIDRFGQTDTLYNNAAKA